MRWCLLALMHISLCAASDMAGMAEQVFGMQQPQVVSQMQPSELESLTASGAPQLAVNGLPFVPMDVAVNQFLQKEQQEMERAEQNAAASAQLMDLEKGKAKAHLAPKKHSSAPAAHSLPGGLQVHAAVPKLQQWLTAMDPMAYASPTFTNPVAKQFFKKLSDPGTLPSQRNQMMQTVSSPYMFNMLGNPAFADPQLWSGLVSGAAVPYPMRNMIFAQRTGLPSQLARTGSAMTPTDDYAMKLYENDAQANGPSIGHGPRRHLFQVLKTLQTKVRAHTHKLKPTPHEEDSVLHRFRLESKDLHAVKEEEDEM